MSRIRQNCFTFCERFGSCCSGSNIKSNPTSPQSLHPSDRKPSGKQPSRTQPSNGAKRVSGAANGVTSPVSGELSNGQQLLKSRAESQPTTHSLANGNGSAAAADAHCSCDTCRAQQSDRRTEADSSASSSGSDETTNSPHAHYSHSQPSATPKHSVVHVTSSSAQNGTMDSLHSTHSAQCPRAGAPARLVRRDEMTGHDMCRAEALPLAPPPLSCVVRALRSIAIESIAIERLAEKS